MSSTEKSGGTDRSDDTERPHKAGAFDMRNFIAGLLGLYGIILVIYGIIGSSDVQLKKSDGLNINLVAGIGMLLVSAAFITWARLRPVVVPAHLEDPEAEGEGRPPVVH